MKIRNYTKSLTGLVVVLLGMSAALLFALPAGAGEPAEAADVCGHVTLEWIRGQVPAARPMPETTKILLKQPRGEFCEVVLGFEGRLAPLYAGKDAVVAGKMYSRGEFVSGETIAGLADVAKRERKLAMEKEKAAAEARKGFYKKNYAGLGELVSMRFRPDSERSLYVITDPRCSHCKALMPELEAAACEKADGLISKTVDFMKTAGQSAVPVVIAADGSWMVEGNNINRIRTHLGLEPLDGAGGDAGTCQDG